MILSLIMYLRLNLSYLTRLILQKLLNPLLQSILHDFDTVHRINPQMLLPGFC